MVLQIALYVPEQLDNSHFPQGKNLICFCLKMRCPDSAHPTCCSRGNIPSAFLCFNGGFELIPF